MNDMLSPIVLFTYNRPDHTKQVLDALALNEEAKNSILYVFCDGAKNEETSDNLSKINEVRNLINNEDRFKEVIIKVQDKNKGLANSIIDGVTDIVNIHDKVIVLEDDIVTSNGFLKYMNEALTFYHNNEKVMHISGFMYPHEEKLPETFFFNVPLCWGWATWKRAWNYFDNDSLKLWQDLKYENKFKELDKFGGDYLSSQLAHNISGKLKTWFIKWHASVLLNNGYTLYPNKSLVDNIGFDNTGVHNKQTTQFQNLTLAEQINIGPIDFNENQDAERVVKMFYNKLLNPVSVQKNIKLKTRLKYKIRRLFFKIFPDIKKALDERIEATGIINNSYTGDHCKIYSKYRLFNSIIGSYTYVAENSIISNTIIGKFCSIGPNLICGWGIHPTNALSTHPMFYSTKKQNGTSLSEIDKIEETKNIIIGNDVFIGMNVTILDGVKIGDGAVIGAGAIVSKDIPAYAIAVGNPIRIIKYRFDDAKINQLLKIKWWDFAKEDLPLVEKYFFEVEEFINKMK
ncbi:DapH/DapD/GlmU-related protein [Flavobacterium pectinovorum]|nr:DapH/DapD/GlmU-related protein [Flavobacterium pectinovorum]